MLWEVVSNKSFVVVCKPNGIDDLICIWELDASMYISNLNNRKLLLIKDKYVTHSLEHVGGGEIIWFSTLQVSNMTIAFVAPNVTSVVQPLNQGIIASFKVRFKRKLLEGVLSQFDSYTHQVLVNKVPNLRYVIIWCSQVWRETSESYGTTWGCPKFYLQTWLLTLSWIMKMRTWEWKKQKWNW